MCKSIYFKNNSMMKEDDLDNLFELEIKPIVQNNKVLALKGLGSKISRINWKMFFGIDPCDINKDNFTYLNSFNYQVMNWLYLNLDTIKEDTVVVQYDGDLILEDNDGDCLLQNYTGILPGLLFYLKDVLHKRVELLVLLETDEKNWMVSNINHWTNGLNQLRSTINIDIHFIQYDLRMHIYKEQLLNYSVKQLNSHINTDIWGYKGYLNQELLYNLNYSSIIILVFGVGSTIVDEISYIDYFNVKLFNLVKNNIYFFNLSRMKQLSTPIILNNNVDYQVIENIHICMTFLNK